MSLRDNKTNKDFRFDLNDLTLVKPIQLVGKTITVCDCDYVNCKDDVKRLALVTTDNTFFFAPKVFEDVFKTAAVDGDDYMELRAGMKITIKKSTSKNGQEYYDFDWAD